MAVSAPERQCYIRGSSVPCLRMRKFIINSETRSDITVHSEGAWTLELFTQSLLLDEVFTGDDAGGGEAIGSDLVVLMSSRF